MSVRRIRVLCVDDHAFMVEGLRARLEMEPDFEFVGRLPTADDLIAEARRLRPTVVLLDIEMPGADVFEIAGDLHRMLPDVRVVFLSAFVRDHYLAAAVEAGAWGYFSKSDEPDEIIAGVRDVANGRLAFGPSVQERCRPTPAGRGRATTPPTTRLDSLSPREQEVLRLIGRGLSRSEIARALSRSPKTVDGHREKIMEKLDLHDRAALVRFAIAEGLVEV
ncbi:MAG: response regulator transcription factor [Phycisphaerales bacterium]|nr:response regulator transcription factor [Phycisphaerales bacterium]MCA9296027.1 response regulator transcription factor [Phycisphaerales bacterium]